MGWLTTEQLVWNDKGYLATHAPSTYKIPATGDIPEHFKVDLWPEPNREDNVFGSKAVGEPPFMLAISVWEALRRGPCPGSPARLIWPSFRLCGSSARWMLHGLMRSPGWPRGRGCGTGWTTSGSTSA
jgi:hypothetical protein